MTSHTTSTTSASPTTSTTDVTVLAKGDSAATGEDTRIGAINVLGNDLGATAKNLYSVTTPSELGAATEINSDGTVSYDPTRAGKIQALAANAHATDTFTYTLREASGATSTATVSVTLTGANDAATISGLATGALTEDAATAIAGGTLSVADADAGEATFQALADAALAGTYGAFAFDAGTWTYTLDNNRPAVQALAAGQQRTDTLTVSSLDGTDSRQIVVTVTGANDAATISGLATGALTEDAATAIAGGTLSVADADAGEATFQALADAALAGTYGAFAFDAGTWTYTLDNNRPAVQALAAGQQRTDTLTVSSLDGTDSRQIVVTVTGANDAPVGIPDTGSGSENENTAAGAVIVDLNATDVDGDTVSYYLKDTSGARVQTNGDFTIDSATGVVTTARAFDFETDGPSKALTVFAGDDKGGEDSGVYTVSIGNMQEGFSGAPLASKAVTGTPKAGDALTVTQGSLADPDGIASLSYRWQSLEGGQWKDIAGATGMTYTLTTGESGESVRAVATMTDKLGKAEEVASNAFDVQAAATKFVMDFDTANGSPKSYSEEGLTVQSISPDAGAHLHFTNIDNQNGFEIFLHEGNAHEPYQFTRSAGGTFSLFEFDMLQSDNNGLHTFTSDKGSQAFTGAGHKTFNSSIFTDVSYVNWNTNSGAQHMDNLVWA